MITCQQVADLQPGDVVELVFSRFPDVVMRGPLTDRGGDLCLGFYSIRQPSGATIGPGADLTVVSRAPRPLYVNHPRTEPVPGDVVRDADGVVWLRDSFTTWHSADSTCEAEHQDTGLAQPLHLLVDGETGQAVTS